MSLKSCADSIVTLVASSLEPMASLEPVALVGCPNTLRAHFKSTCFSKEGISIDSEHRDDNKCKASGLGPDDSCSVELLQPGERNHKNNVKRHLAQSGVKKHRSGGRKP